MQNPHFHELHRDSVHKEYCAPSLASSACHVSKLNPHSHPKGMFYQDKNTAARREKPEKSSMAQKGRRGKRCPNSELVFGYSQPHTIPRRDEILTFERNPVSSETVKKTAASRGLGGLLLPSGGNPKRDRMGERPFGTTGRGNSKFTHILSSSGGKSRNNL